MSKIIIDSDHSLKQQSVQGIIGILVIPVLIFVCFLFGVRINITESLPRGVYVTSKSFSGRSDVGRLVEIKQPDDEIFSKAVERGYLRDKQITLLKRLIAIEGDFVEVNDSGLVVNGTLIKNSKQMSIFGHLNRAKTGIVQAGKAWVVNEYHPASFDSRYFGQVDTRQIVGVVKPLILFDGWYE